MASPTNLSQYYSGKGQALPSIGERSKVYESYGLGSASSYSGTAQQNTALLQRLVGGGPTSTPTQVPTTAPQATLSSPTQVTPFLNTFQSALFTSQSSPEVRTPRGEDINPETGKAFAVNPETGAWDDNYFNNVVIPKFKSSMGSGGGTTIESLKQELAPSIPRPESLNRVEQLTELRTTHGVAQLEESLSSVKAEIAALDSANQQRLAAAEGKPVALGVIAGRQTEIARQDQIKKDTLLRQQSVIVDELNTKYGVINQMMTLLEQNYADAVERYDKEYARNIQLYGIVEQKEADEKTAARANLQIYMNALTKGNIDYGALSADQRLLINKLEIQSGLPVGFMSSIRKDPNADILFTSSNEGVTQVGIRNADGTISVQSYGTRISSATSNAKALRQQFGAAATPGAGNNFPDLVEQFANTMSLEEIYQAYATSEMGRKYGNPKEDKRVIQVVYKVARGDISEDEAREKLGY